MAATATLEATAGLHPSAALPLDLIKVVADSSYVSGGYDVDLAALMPGREVKAVVPIMSADGYLGVWDAAADKMMFYECGGAGAVAQEVGATTDLTDKFVTALVVSE